MKTAKKIKIALILTAILMTAYMVTAYFQLERIKKNMDSIMQINEKHERSFFNLALEYYDRLLKIKTHIIKKQSLSPREILLLSSSFKSLLIEHLRHSPSIKDRNYALALAKIYDLLLIKVKKYSEGEYTDIQLLNEIINDSQDGIKIIKEQVQFFVKAGSSSVKFESNRAITQSITWLLLLSSLSLITVLLIAAYIFKEVIKPIETLTSNIEKLGADSTAFLTEEGASIEVTALAEKLGHKFYELTHYDKLTGLANQSLLTIILEQKIKQLKPPHDKFAILLIGLDKFSKVNEVYGLSVGEHLLKIIAKRIKSHIPDSAFLARERGDQFVVILTKDEGHEQFIEFITAESKQLLKSIAMPCHIDSRELHITACIGICVFPEDGTTADELLKNSHHAISQAKNEGINNFQFFSQILNAQAIEDAQIEQDLRHAIKNKQLMIYYQPQVDTATKKIIGAEALIRWHHERRGFISTEHFLSIAEAAELIVPLTDWVIQTVCEQIKAWKEEGIQLDKISINLAAQQFRSENVISDTQNILEHYGLDPDLIAFEITESTMMQDIVKTADILQNLKKIGVMIAIDDFGTGYSSLSYLKDLPADFLKIDKSFIDNIETDHSARSIAESIIILAHSLNLKVIAEGISNTRQFQMLKEAKCDLIQGYIVSKPLPMSEFTQLLKEWNPDDILD